MFEKSISLWEKPKSDKFIYALIDPRTDEIKYIGQTYKGLLRLQRHTYLLETKEKTKKHFWIKELKKNNLLFNVIFLEYCETQQQLNESETFFIQYFRSIGCNLLNHYDGGDGHVRPKMTSEQLEIHKKRMKIVMNDPEVRKKMSKSHLGKSPSNKGQSKSFETIQKIKEKNKLRAIKVIDSNGIIYKSLLDASKKLKCTPTDIRRCILNKNKIFKGLSFKKLES